MGSGLKALLLLAAVFVAAACGEKPETPTEAANAIKSTRPDLPKVPDKLLANGVGGGGPGKRGGGH